MYNKYATYRVSILLALSQHADDDDLVVEEERKKHLSKYAGVLQKMVRAEKYVVDYHRHPVVACSKEHRAACKTYLVIPNYSANTEYIILTHNFKLIINKI